MLGCLFCGKRGLNSQTVVIDKSGGDGAHLVITTDLELEKVDFFADSSLETTSVKVLVKLRDTHITNQSWDQVSDAVNGICSTVDLINLLVGNDQSIISLEIEDTVGFDVISDLKASMIDLVELDQVALVVLVNGKVLHINNT